MNTDRNHLLATQKHQFLAVIKNQLKTL